MSERIRELALQCGAWHQVYGDKQFMVNKNFDVEKLAMLVVQDCIDIVENLSPGYKDYRDQIEDAFRRDCILEIKHKFGIKDEKQCA
jgi:hypothetical protein